RDSRTRRGGMTTTLHVRGSIVALLQRGDRDAARYGEVDHGPSIEGVLHEVAPDGRRCDASLVVVAERSSRVVSHPHARDQVGGVADEPGATVVVRRPRLARHGPSL